MNNFYLFQLKFELLKKFCIQFSKILKITNTQRKIYNFQFTYQMANILMEKVDPLKIQDPPFNGRNLTNRVLENKAGSKIMYYCPAYMRMKVKNFAEMSIKNLQASVNSTIIYSVRLTGLPNFFIDHLKKSLILRFNRDDALTLDEANKEITLTEYPDDYGLFRYTVRKTIKTGIDPQVTWSPFQILNLIMSVTTQGVTYSLNDQIKKMQEEKQKLQQQMGVGAKNSAAVQQITKQIQAIQEFKSKNKGIKSITVKLNLMDLTKQSLSSKYAESQEDLQSMVRNTKISYSDEGTFGNYDLAEKKLHVYYSNESVYRTTKQKSDKRKNNIPTNEDYSKTTQFQNAHFVIPLYKFPLVTIFTIFLPLWLMGMINIGIFFQEPGLADRIGTLAGLMIAYIALIPSFRQELPPTSQITLVEILVYIQCIPTLVCFAQSLIHRFEDDNYQQQFTWYKDPFCIISIVVQLLQVTFIVVLLLRYWLVDSKEYNELNIDAKQAEFNLNQWGNQECDRHFQRKIDSGQIRVLQRKKKNKKDEEEQQQRRESEQESSIKKQIKQQILSERRKGEKLVMKEEQ